MRQSIAFGGVLAALLAAGPVLAAKDHVTLDTGELPPFTKPPP